MAVGVGVCVCGGVSLRRSQSEDLLVSSFCLAGNIFILPLFLKNSLARYTMYRLTVVFSAL